MATAQNNTNGGRQLTIQVMRSYISLASTGRETPEPEEEEELLECGAFRRSVSETPSPPLSPLPPQQETVRERARVIVFVYLAPFNSLKRVIGSACGQRELLQSVRCKQTLASLSTKQ